MRHGARGNPRDLNHVIRGHYRYARWNHVTVQIKVHDISEIPVGREIHFRGKHAESDSPDDLVVPCGVLPKRAERLAVGDRNVVVLLVGRNGESMRTINIDGHDSGVDFVIDGGATRTKLHQCDLVGCLRGNVDVICALLRKERNGGKEI